MSGWQLSEKWGWQMSQKGGWQMSQNRGWQMSGWHMYHIRSLINTEEADKICSEKFKDKRILIEFKPGSGIDQQRRDRGTFFKPAQLSLSSSGDL